MQYMKEFYVRTLVGVKRGDEAMISAISGAEFIMSAGPDAHEASGYQEGVCKAQDVLKDGGAEAVKAIRSLASVAWFSISPGHNHLWTGGDGELSELGRAYFDACKAVRTSASPGASPAENSTLPNVNSTLAPADADVDTMNASTSTSPSLPVGDSAAPPADADLDTVGARTSQSTAPPAGNLTLPMGELDAENTDTSLRTEVVPAAEDPGLIAEESPTRPRNPTSRLPTWTPAAGEPLPVAGAVVSRRGVGC